LPDRLEEIFDRAAVGIAQLDTAGRFLLVNDSYCEMLGRRREDLLRARLQDVTHPDDLPASLDAFIGVIESGASRIVEQRYLRPDGSAAWVGNTVSVARSAEGKPQYVLVVAQDIGARKHAERELTQAQADLRLLLDSAADGFYCIDRQGRITLCNAAFLRMLGFEREADAIGEDLHGVIHHSRADGSAYPREECPIFKAAQYGTHAHVTDEVFFRRDGTSFPVEYWARPIVRSAEIQGAVCTFVDATPRKQVEARQELLNRELAHRVKNTLAMVQAIVGQTLRNSPATREAVHAIDQRLVALGHAHTALMRSRWGNASIIDVVEGAIAAHRSAASRIRLDGPRMDVGAKAALGITLALHELCTNAAKYGALSNDAGTVAIDWSVTGGAADARFHLSWSERGGPPVTPPQRKGFGSRLVAEAVGADLKGQARLSFEPAGVLWTLDGPLTAVKESF